MIHVAPVVVKAALVIGVVGEAALLAVAQVTTVDTTAVWVAALGFGGLIVTSVLTFVGQRAAAREQRDAAREQRQAAARQVEKVEEIHTLVNSKDDAQSRRIAELTAQVEAMHKAALAKAEAAAPVVKPDADAATNP